MTRDELLEYIVARLGRNEESAVFSADELRQWPEGAHADLISARVLQRMPPAHVLECDGCERHCFKHVHVRQRPDGQGAAAFITCDEPEDFGRIRVDLTRLEQGQARSGVAALVLAQALGCPVPPGLATRVPRQSGRDAAIKAKYEELTKLGQRNYVKQIQRSIPGADTLSERRIRSIAKGH